MQNILFKAIGSAKIGLGHISRITSLIRALPTNWSYVFHVNDNPFVKDFLLARNITFTCEDPVQLLQNQKFDRVVYDQLVIEEKFLKETKIKKVSLVGALDFFFYEKSYVDVIINILNQNLKAQCPLNAHTRYFEGLEYVIISEIFRKERKQKSHYLDFKNILVMFGGADPNGNTIKTMNFLNKIKNKLHINVIIGPLNSQKNKIFEVIKKTKHTVHIFENPADLIHIMQGSDAAFTGCGTTCFELGFLGVPSIIIPQNNPEQRLAELLCARRIVLAGNSIESCWHEINKEQTRMELSFNARQLFDGRGVERIFSCFEIN